VDTWEEANLQNKIKAFFTGLVSLTGRWGKKRRIWGVIAVLGILLALYLLLGGSSKVDGGYLTDTVKSGGITKTIAASGTVEPVQTISMSFKDAEIVKKIYVQVGDRVEPGQLLAELETYNLEADVVQARANYNSQAAKYQLEKNGATQEELEESEAKVSMAQASYDQARASLDRYEALYQAGALALADLEQEKTNFANDEAGLKQAKASLRSLQKGSRPEDIASAAAQVESAGAQLQTAERSLSDARLVCPIHGIVSSVSGAEGQRASANNNNTSGEGFMEVISEALQVEAQINEGDIGQARVGQKVQFTVNSYPEKTFAGQVSSISPTATTQSNVQIYDVIIQLDSNYAELKAGMPTDVTIIVEQSQDVLTIPKGAVTYAESYLAGAGKSSGSRPQSGSGEKEGSAATTAPGAAGKTATVLVMGQAGPEPRQVELGLSDLTSYQVISGLKEGETVITGSMGQNETKAADSNSGGSKSRSGQGALGGPGGPPPGGN
jgi:HlyD family secretion protein